MNKRNNEIDENFYNEKALYLLNIRELRDLGRKLGVPSPTTMKKEDLVSYILNIIYGEVEVPKRNACGRPSVREIDMEYYVNKVKKRSDINSELKYVTIGAGIESILKVASPSTEIHESNVEQKVFVEEDGKWFLRKHGFVASTDDIEVMEHIVKKFKLENFDIVEIVRFGNAYKILTINGECTSDAEKIKNKKPGEKQVFHLRTKEEIKEEIKNLGDICNKQKIQLVVLTTNNYSLKNAHIVVVDEEENSPQIYKKFMSFVNFCEKQIFENETIAVAIDSVELIEKAIESFEEDVTNRIKNHLQEQIAELLELGNDLYVYKLDKIKKY